MQGRHALERLKELVPRLMPDPGHQPIRLVCREQDLQSLRRALVPERNPGNLEHARIAFLGRGYAGQVLELYLSSILPPGDYRAQSPTTVELSARYMLQSFDRFAESDLGVFLHAHSHPFTPRATFSGTDDYYLGRAWSSLGRFLRNTRRERDFLYARLVYGREEPGFTLEVIDASGTVLGQAQEIKVVGPSGIRRIASFQHGAKTPSGQPGAAFDRNIRWLGEEAQRRLSRVHLVVCGAGGVGSQVVSQAAGLGFRRMTIVDHDVVEESNLNRLAGAGHHDVGSPKVQVLARGLRRFDPSIRVQAVQSRIDEPAAEEAIRAGDVIVAGVDSDAARLSLQVLAARHLKPLLDMGSGIALDHDRAALRAMGGQALFYVPGGPCLLCQGLNPAPQEEAELRVQRAVGYVSGTDIEDTPPSVVTVNAITAGLGMDQLVRYLTGYAPVSPHLGYDLIQRRFTSLAFARRDGCPVCGPDGVEAAGAQEAQPLPPPRPGALDAELADLLED